MVDSMKQEGSYLSAMYRIMALDSEHAITLRRIECFHKLDESVQDWSF